MVHVFIITSIGHHLHPASTWRTILYVYAFSIPCRQCSEFNSGVSDRIAVCISDQDRVRQGKLYIGWGQDHIPRSQSHEERLLGDGELHLYRRHRADRGSNDDPSLGAWYGTRCVYSAGSTKTVCDSRGWKNTATSDIRQGKTDSLVLD